jgi:LysM repeat protein
MELLLKPGTGTGLRAWSGVKKLCIALVIIIWIIVTTACSLSTYYVSALDLTATAAYSVLTPEALITSETETSPGSLSDLVKPPLVEVTATTPEIQDSTITPDVEESTPVPTATRNTTPKPPIIYYSQAGDTLPVIAARFGVDVLEIQSQESITTSGLLSPNTLLIIPDYYGANVAADPVLPDSEIVYSPSTLDLDLENFVKQAGGYLSSYREYHVDRWYSGAEIIQLVAIQDSINPRLLLALIEYQSHWVYGRPENLAQEKYPLGYVMNDREGLYKQLTYGVQSLSMGYYGWREGRITEIVFKDGTQQRIAPNLNAGSAAIQQFFANFYDPARWLGTLYGPGSLPELFGSMFGSPWLRAQTVEPLFPISLTQPKLEFPFEVGKIWSYSGGPHPAWGLKGSWAAIDFAPASDQHGCVKSPEWVTASAPGLVVRTGPGIVVVDLDGDGYEQTGWVMLYLHIASSGKVEKGAYLEQDQKIGHPSCEGGSATGTHVHIARKFNGEWIPADGPLPFELGGWVVHKGDLVYEGTMTRGDDVITARTYGSFETIITR